MISLNGAMCRINRHANLEIDRFEIRSGEHWCVFGPNGAGKSLLAALLSNHRIETGQYVTYNENFDPHRDCLFVSFEEQQRLWQHDNRLDMSEYSDRAEDQGTLVGELIRSARPDANDADAILDDLVRQLDLKTILDKGIRFLSSGQIRRVLIARALFAAVNAESKLLIFDDPLEAIDKDSRVKITTCIERYQTSGFASLFLCRRQQDMPPNITHLAVMENLRLSAQGTRDEVIGSAALQSLFKRAPTFDSALPIQSDADEQHSGTPYIELKAVNAGYGEQQVLSNINWVMNAHDHVLIEGPNGCGKSTLLSLIDGENHKAYGQEVYLFGQRRGSGETVWDVKSRFGVVSNELHNKYVKGWKVLDVVVSGYFDSVGLYDDSGSAEWDGARQWLGTLGIADLEKHYYHELSFGQQRVVLLARAMVKQPTILILDEPCVGLDDYYRQLILGTLQLIAEQSNTRIIYVSHVADERPTFITQRLSFVPNNGGGFTIEQQSL